MDGAWVVDVERGVEWHQKYSSGDVLAQVGGVQVFGLESTMHMAAASVV